MVKTALKAANLIGVGLYGVDLKLTDHGPVVIEVNDNPSLESDVEDQVLGEGLYRTIIGEFVTRLDRRKQGRRLGDRNVADSSRLVRYARRIYHRPNTQPRLARLPERRPDSESCRHAKAAVGARRLG